MIEPSRLLRKAVLGLPGYKSGVSPRLLKALAAGEQVSRLASNENLYGASPRVYEALREIRDVHLYPDADSTELRSALATRFGIDAERFLVSTGSENVLSTVFQCVVSPGERVVTLAPTFMLADILAGSMDAVHVGVGYEDDLSFSAEAVAAEAKSGAKIVYLSNPNNPTGNAFSPEELHTVVHATTPETLVIVDEAYYEYAIRHDGFAGSLAILEASGRPYIVLRTFSKAYGLAGLRVGYGIFYHSELASLVRRGSTIFDVGTISQRAALAALEDQAHVDRVAERTIAEKSRVLATVAERNLRVFPSFGNFVSLWCPTRRHALERESALAKRGVFAKALPAKGDEGLLRVTVGRPEDNDRFLEALRDFVGNSE